MLGDALIILRLLVGSHTQQQNEPEMCILVESGCVEHVLSHR
jgi:hypothetical protein